MLHATNSSRLPRRSNSSSSSSEWVWIWVRIRIRKRIWVRVFMHYNIQTHTHCRTHTLWHTHTVAHSPQGQNLFLFESARFLTCAARTTRAHTAKGVEEGQEQRAEEVRGGGGCHRVLLTFLALCEGWAELSWTELSWAERLKCPYAEPSSCNNCCNSRTRQGLKLAQRQPLATRSFQAVATANNWIYNYNDKLKNQSRNWRNIKVN